MGQSVKALDIMLRWVIAYFL